MEIITKTEGNKATMEISGWLDTQTAPQLGEALSGLEDSITSLVFDFTNLEYISSAGLRQVIVAYKKMAPKDGFKIINVSEAPLHTATGIFQWKHRFLSDRKRRRNQFNYQNN